MKTALLLIRPLPHYRRDGFESGLKRLGYQIEYTYNPKKLCDLVIVWNRHGIFNNIASMYEKSGRCVIVAENGYVGLDEFGHHLFALALNHHMGIGHFPVGDYSRWEKLGVPVKPWRVSRGRDLLLLPQRGIGAPGVAMPRNWTETTTASLREYKRFIRVRKHPGGAKNIPVLEGAFNGVHAAVVWASSAGIKAIINGLPVVYGLPGWIGADGASKTVDDLFTGDRTAMLTRVAWGQSSIAEIASGEALKRLLDHRETLI